MFYFGFPIIITIVVIAQYDFHIKNSIIIVVDLIVLFISATLVENSAIQIID